MYTFSTVALAAATFVTVMQPCPAPPAVIGALGAGATAILGGAASGAASAGVEAAAGKRSEQSEEAELKQGLTECFAKATAHPPTAAPGPGKSIIVNNLPPSCLKEIHDYNTDPRNAAMAQVHGTTTPINATAVKLDGIPDGTFAQISELIKAQPEDAGKPQRRAMRFEKY